MADIEGVANLDFGGTETSNTSKIIIKIILITVIGIIMFLVFLMTLLPSMYIYFSSRSNSDPEKNLWIERLGVPIIITNLVTIVVMGVVIGYILLKDTIEKKMEMG